MKGKKLITAMLAGAIFTCVLSSCGTTTEDNGKTKVSIGNWPATEGKQLDSQNELKAKFEEAYPDIEIVPDTWTYDVKTFYTKAETGVLPDVFWTHFTEFQKLTDGEYAADITEQVNAAGYYEKINPKLRDLVTLDGRIYALPQEAYALCINYNVELFEKAGFMNEDGTPKAPMDWYELAEMAQKIKEVTGVPGFTLETMNNCGGWFFTNIAWGFGTDFMEQDDSGKWIATFDTPETVEALQFVKDLKWKYDCVPSNTLIDQAEATKLYATGGTAMVLEAPQDNKVAKFEMDVNDFGIMPVPAGTKRHVALLGGKLKVIDADATKETIDAAFKWLDFTGFNSSITDAAKESREKSYIASAEQGKPIGVKVLSIWGDDSETIAHRNEMIDKYCNINPNHVKLYNESLKDPEIELQPEEPVCCQDLYSILDNIIQEVYNNKDADCAALVKQANSDFQKNYLDKMDY